MKIDGMQNELAFICAARDGDRETLDSLLNAYRPEVVQAEVLERGKSPQDILRQLLDRDQQDSGAGDDAATGRTVPVGSETEPAV